MGWPLPERVVDLHAVFRRLTSGILDPGDYALGGALDYHRLQGEGVEGFERLLRTLQEKLDIPRALLQGRYGAAVARMEATGVPIDRERWTLLREG